MLIIVNFHYIQPEGRYPHPGIHARSPEELKEQLERLSRGFEFISGKDLVFAVRNERSLPDHSCLITFDDGLKDQYENAIPILDELGVPAVFFICSQPISEHRAITVHKTHWLRATRPADVFRDLAFASAESLDIELDLSRADDVAASRHYPYDDPPIRRLKFLLNHLIPPNDHQRILDDIFKDEADEVEFCRSFYMSESQVGEISRNYMIGSHSHSHVSLSTMSDKSIVEELRTSKLILEDVIGDAVEIVSYPYGGYETVTRSIAEAADQVGYAAGLTMEFSANQSLVNPLLLSRLDTNHAPGGKIGAIHVREDGYTFDPPVTEYRTFYFDERALLDGVGSSGHDKTVPQRAADGPAEAAIKP